MGVKDEAATGRVQKVITVPQADLLFHLIVYLSQRTQIFLRMERKLTVKQQHFYSFSTDCHRLLYFELRVFVLSLCVSIQRFSLNFLLFAIKHKHTANYTTRYGSCYVNNKIHTTDTHPFWGLDAASLMWPMRRSVKREVKSPGTVLHVSTHAISLVQSKFLVGTKLLRNTSQSWWQ